MSLIADALKTAQRQRQMRESGGNPTVAPVLLSLRPGQRAFDWRRALTVGVSAVVIVVSLVIMVARMKPKPALTTLPPVPSPLAGTPLLAENTRQGSPGGSSPQATIPAADRAYAARVASVPPIRLAPSAPPRNAESTPAVPLKEESPAQLQGRSTADSVPLNPSRVQPGGRLRIAMEQPPQSDVARLFAEALAAHRAGNLALARPLYERVLFFTPNDADALNNLGVLLSAQREFDRALELLRRAASVAPNNAGTWNNIGAVLREQGRNSDASAAFRHALTIDPRHQGAMVGLAQQNLANGLHGQARALLEEVLAMNPGLAEAHYALGQVLELQGDKAGAIRSFSAFLRLAPPRLADHVERVRRHVDSLTAGTQ